MSEGRVRDGGPKEAERRTERTREIHRLIAALLARHGHAPSIRDLAAAADCSVSTVHRHLGILERQGVLRRRGGLARSLLLVPQAETAAIGATEGRLEEHAAAFEERALHFERLLPPGLMVPVEVELALRAACFRGYAHGVRWAERQIAPR